MAWHTTRPSPTWSRSWPSGASRCCGPRCCSPAARRRARTCCRPGWSGCCGTGTAIEGDPEGYLRRTLYNLAADGWRRQRAWRRRLPLLQNETATAVADGTARGGHEGRPDPAADAAAAAAAGGHRGPVLGAAERGGDGRRSWAARSARSRRPPHGGCAGCASSAGRARRGERPGRGEDTMSTDLEQQLRGAMERFTSDVRVPPGLALKAYRHRQKRRMTGRVAAAAGTATVVAGSLAVAGAAGAFGSASRAPVQTAYTAYVITHVEHALAAPRIGNLVEADRTVFSPGSTLQPFPDGSGRVRGRRWFQLAVAGRLHASLDLSRLHRALLVHGQRAAGLRLGNQPGARNHRGDLRERHLVDRAGASVARAGAGPRLRLPPGPRDCPRRRRGQRLAGLHPVPAGLRRVHGGGQAGDRRNQHHQDHRGRRPVHASG